MSTIVGQLAIELGLDTAKLEAGLKNIGSSSQRSFSSMSAAAKQSSREGAESLRLFDEAFGIHISRPIAKILANEFPALAKGLQSMLGAGVALGVGIAAFDFLSKAIDGVIKKMDEAKKAQLAYEEAVRNTARTLDELASSHEKRMLQLQAELDALSGNKEGELQNKIKLADIDDAERAISDIDRVTKQLQEEAKTAMEAATATHRFWLALNDLASSNNTLAQEKTAKDFEDFRLKYEELTRKDATEGTQKGLEVLKQKAAELDKQLSDAQAHRISDFQAFINHMGKLAPAAEGGIPGAQIVEAFTKEGSTDKQIIQLQSQKKIVDEYLQINKDVTAEHNKQLQVLKQQEATERDIGEKQLTKLRSETEADLALAAATSKTTAEQKLATAAGQADQIIAGIQEAAHGRLTKQVQEELLAVHALTAERQVAKDTVATNDSLEKSLETTRENTAAANELAAAYEQGGAALESALIDQQLKSQISEVRRLHEEYDLAKKAADDYAASASSLGKQAGPKPGLDISPEHLAQLKAGLDAADAKLAELKTAQAADNQAKYNDELAKSEVALKGEQPLLDALNKAYGENEIAVRKAETALALYHWEQSHPNATQDEIARENALLEQQAIDAQRAADAKAAGSYNIAELYQNEIDKLLRIKDVLIENGESTILIDAKIHDAQDALIHQWDEAAMKVGDFHDKFTAVMNEVVLQGQEASQKMLQSWVTAINGFNDSFAKLMTGQKTDFGKVFLQLAQEQTKSQMAQLESTVAQHYNLSIPGAGRKPDGTSGNPLHVAIVSDSTRRSVGGAGATSPVGGGGAGGPGGARGAGGPAINEVPSTMADFFKTVFSFGGFLADGGQTKPGTSYIVGENGPELFRSSTNGQIIPNNQLGGNQNFQFGPGDRDWKSYQNYLNWVHNTSGKTSGLGAGLGALLGFGVTAALHGLDSLISPRPSRGQIAAGMPAKSGSLADLDALTASASPQAASLASASVLPNLPKPGDVDAGYMSNWASEYTPPPLAGALATGGDVFADNTYLVGERGPEEFRVPGLSGSTTNNRGGDTYHNTVNFNGKSAGTDLFKYTSKHDIDRMLARMKP